MKASQIFNTDVRKGSDASINSLPAKFSASSTCATASSGPANLSLNSTCAALLGSSTLAIAAGVPGILGPEMNNLNLEPTPSPCVSRRGSLKPAARGLKESFRKLVRPMVRKREERREGGEQGERGTPELQERGVEGTPEQEEESCLEIRVPCRRESRWSESAAEKAEDSPPSSRWRRILGVSLAISRSILYIYIYII